MLNASKTAEEEEYKTEFDFFSLPRPVQDRFVASVTGTGVPSPILFEPAGADRALRWIAVVVVSVVLVLLLGSLGFGQLGHDWALQPMYLVAVYALLAGAALVSVLLYLRAKSADLRYLYRQGIYLFPAGVVRVSGGKLRLYPISGLDRVEAQGKSSVVITIATVRFKFSLLQGLTVERLERLMGKYRAAFAEARAARDRKLLATLDPIRDSGFSNPLSSRERIAPAQDARVFKFALASILGVSIGVMGYFARNTLAEKRLFQAAYNQNSSKAFQQYLSAGGARETVSSVLLPRAELKERRGSLGAVEAFAAANVDARIRPEIDVALREELLHYLAKTSEKGSLKALKEFTQAHPQHRRVSHEIAEARAAIYAAAEASFQSKYQVSPKAQKLFEELIRYSQLHGGTVQLRFRRHLPSSAERADNSIRKSAYFTGNHAIPSQYFRAPHALAREKEAARQLLSFLQAPFSKEILHFELGEPMEGEPTAELPPVKVPTLFISHSTEMSGGYTTQRPRGVYVGLGKMFRAVFVVPDTNVSFRFRYSSWLPPDVNVIWHEKLTPEQVYDRNARLGFRRFLSNLKEALFSPNAAAKTAKAPADLTPAGNLAPEDGPDASPGEPTTSIGDN